MEQLDAFTKKRFELMVEMTTKKLQQEMNMLKEGMVSLNSEISSLKSQISRIQFQPQSAASNHQQELNHFVANDNQSQNLKPQKEVKIVDLRPEGEKIGEFKSGAAKNSEPIRPRYGDYKPEDVSIDKFFYFGNKRK
jgi:predicted  nucleic acid-binding Zn-ribbon protein